jgi:hypothetical protein
MSPEDRFNEKQPSGLKDTPDNRSKIIELAQGAIPGSIAAGAISGAFLPSIFPFAVITGAIFGMLTSLRIGDYIYTQ